MRDNKAGQSNRSKGGNRFQETVHAKLEEFLETSGLDARFTLLSAKKITIAVKIRGVEKTKVISPDHAICDKQTGAFLVFFGDKKSLRERWKEDDRDAILAKEAFPGCGWIETTEQEHLDDSSVKIAKHLAGIWRQSEFDILYSTALNDSKKAMFEWLKSYLTRR